MPDVRIYSIHVSISETVPAFSIACLALRSKVIRAGYISTQNSGQVAQAEAHS